MEAPQATSFAGPLSLSLFFTKTGQAWAHELMEIGWGLGGPEMLPTPLHHRGGGVPSGPGKKGAW